MKKIQTGSKPNVILMFVDDLGYGDLSLLNENSQLYTGNIDELARSGAVFEDCHATSSLCTPSRYGLLTGRYNWRSRLKSRVLPGGAPPLIEVGRDTLASLFQRHGYYTAAVGKWHLGLGWQRKSIEGSDFEAQEEIQKKLEKGGQIDFILDGMDIDYSKPLTVSPNDYGFDYFFGTAASLDQPPYVYIENRTVLKQPDHLTGVFPLDRNGATQQEDWQRGPASPGYDHRQVIPDMQKKVLELIDVHSEEPFFLYYPTHAVHGPLLPPEGFMGKSGLNLYGDIVLYVDHMVGELVAKLKEKGIWEKTIFIFASDNGCSGIADYPYLLSKGHNPSYIFRGRKAMIWEGGHRIPLIISFPEYFNGEKRIQGMASLSDLYATFAQILGDPGKQNAGEDSVSLVPLLEGEREEIRQSVVHSSARGCFSIRNKEWKLEMCVDSGAMKVEEPEPGISKEFPFQLYHLSEDVSEQHNVASLHPELCMKMMEELLDIIEYGRSTPGIPGKNEGTEDWPQLTELRNIWKMRKSIGSES